MTQEAMNNGIVLYELGIDRQQVEAMQEVFALTPELAKVLNSPVAARKQKHHIIDRVFSKAGFQKNMIHFIQVMCEHNEIAEISDICEAYSQLWDEKHNVKRVRCMFAENPTQEQIESIQKFLQRKYAGTELRYDIQVEPDLLGGVMIQVGHEEYDWSFEGRIRQLEQVIRG